MTNLSINEMIDLARLLDKLNREVAGLAPDDLRTAIAEHLGEMQIIIGHN